MKETEVHKEKDMIMGYQEVEQLLLNNSFGFKYFIIAAEILAILQMSSFVLLSKKSKGYLETLVILNALQFKIYIIICLQQFVRQCCMQMVFRERVNMN